MNERPCTRASKEEQETILVCSNTFVEVSTTIPHHWRALKRRAAKLGGTIEWVDVFIPKKGPKLEIGGSIRFPLESFSLARFGLRATPKKVKP